jgi:hypothetical protein
MKIKDIKVGYVFGPRERVDIAIKAMPSDEVFRGHELSQRAGVGTSDLSKLKSYFPDNYLLVGSKVFWGTQKAISALKDKINENR